LYDPESRAPSELFLKQDKLNVVHMFATRTMIASNSFWLQRHSPGLLLSVERACESLFKLARTPALSAECLAFVLVPGNWLLYTRKRINNCKSIDFAFSCVRVCVPNAANEDDGQSRDELHYFIWPIHAR
jgi:hypothetical protein